MKRLALMLVAAIAAISLGAIPALVIPPGTMTQQMVADKPSKPGSPDGCIPIGVTKTSIGVVYAVEDCNGVIHHHRMSD